MKKLVLMLAAASMAASVSAQTVAESKTFDNIYVGINGGVATKTTGHKWLSDLDPNAGLRIGRYFTPVFGLAIEGNAYFSNKPWGSTGTVVRATNASLLGTVNLSNWFGGYKG
ncbi:MAG: OmpA family protein, partial [Prevotella histicola]|nr:OmpA family protein [Prevotella histicola]